MKIVKLLLIAFCAVAVASCCSCRKGKSRNVVPLVGTTWQLKQMDSVNFTPEGDSFTVVFSSDGKMNGKGDCNRLFGAYEMSVNGVLKMAGVASTRMMCPNQADESKFVSMLQSIDGYTIDGSLLLLTSDGELKLILSEKPVENSK